MNLVNIFTFPLNSVCDDFVGRYKCGNKKERYSNTDQNRKREVESISKPHPFGGGHPMTEAVVEVSRIRLIDKS